MSGNVKKHGKTLLFGFLAVLVFTIAGLGTYAALHTRKKTVTQLQLQSFLAAPQINRATLVGTTGTWSLNTTLNSLQLNWTSNSQNFTVWDSFNGVCGPNSISYARLSNSVWFDSTNYVPYGLGFPSSYTVLTSTNIFTDALSTQNYAFKLVLYQGMLRIEKDGLNPMWWNNYQGKNTTAPISPSVWPSTQDDGSKILWKIGDIVNSAQFRSNGNFLVGSANPFNNPNGFGSWFAETHTMKQC